MPRPETRYARSGDVHIAYQTVGDGPLDVLFIDQWWSNVDGQWAVPPLARMLERLASFSRVIVLDKRGTGLSDPVPLGRLPTLEEWMDDIRAVLDAVGSERDRAARWRWRVVPGDPLRGDVPRTDVGSRSRRWLRPAPRR